MSTSGLGLSAPTTTNVGRDLSVMRLRAEQILKSAAGWFIWIGAMSLINSLIAMFGGGIRFIVGLGVTEFVDGVTRGIGQAATIPGLVINLFVAGLFVFFWQFARKGESSAFIVGMVLYALDGVLLLLFHDILSAAFHAYALFMLYRGLGGISMLRKCQQAELLTGGAIEPR